MKAALRTTTIEEGGFIDSVLVKVGKGQIPADLVDSTFQWARKKPYKHRFQYFKHGVDSPGGQDWDQSKPVTDPVCRLISIFRTNESSKGIASEGFRFGLIISPDIIKFFQFIQ